MAREAHTEHMEASGNRIKPSVETKSDNAQQVIDRLSQIIVDSEMKFGLQDKKQLRKAEEQFRAYADLLNSLDDMALKMLFERITDLSNETLIDELNAMHKFYADLRRQQAIHPKPKDMIPADLRIATERENIFYTKLADEYFRRADAVETHHALQVLLDMPEEEFMQIYDEYTAPFQTIYSSMLDDEIKVANDDEIEDANMVLKARALRDIKAQEKLREAAMRVA